MTDLSDDINEIERIYNKLKVESTEQAKRIKILEAENEALKAEIKLLTEV